jgi:hypothetical protein
LGSRFFLKKNNTKGGWLLGLIGVVVIREYSQKIISEQVLNFSEYT